jgi:sugar lactone lactonase YvrE
VDGAPDGAPPDAGLPDAVPPDAAPPDAAAPDAGPDANLTCTIPSFTSGVSTLAGCDVPAAVDGLRDAARFHNPVNVAVGPEGNIYVADFDNDRIRRVSPSGEVITLTQQSNFHRPFGLAFASDGTLYAQTDDNPAGVHSDMSGTIWRIDVSGAATPLVQDVGRPRGIAVLANGTLVLSDYVHHVIRLFDPVSGLVTPLAGAFDQPGSANGNGPAARFDGPYGVAIRPDGSIAVAEYGGNRIRRVTLIGNVTTIAGTGAPGSQDGAAAAATFLAPQDLAIDSAGTIYVADAGNHVVRRLSGGTVDTVIGSGVGGYLDHDDPRTAQMFGLEGLDLSSVEAKLYIADGSRGEDVNPHHRVRVVNLAAIP